jgi:micrococcal nuclease
VLNAAAAGWVLAALAGTAMAATPGSAWTGRVTRVSDGDTLWVRPSEAGARPLKLRLVDVDAPEICQPWGLQAREALKRQVAGKTVAVQTVARDRYGRILARISLDGHSVGAWMVQEGHAWSAHPDRNDGPLAEQERQARAQRRGLHAAPQAMLPSEFRHRHGPCERPGTPARAQ